MILLNSSILFYHIELVNTVPRLHLLPWCTINRGGSCREFTSPVRHLHVWWPTSRQNNSRPQLGTALSIPWPSVHQLRPQSPRWEPSAQGRNREASAPLCIWQGRSLAQEHPLETQGGVQWWSHDSEALPFQHHSRLGGRTDRWCSVEESSPVIPPLSARNKGSPLLSHGVREEVPWMCWEFHALLLDAKVDQCVGPLRQIYQALFCQVVFWKTVLCSCDCNSYCTLVPMEQGHNTTPSWLFNRG